MRKVENIKYSKFDECVLDIYLPDEDSFSVFVYFHGGGLEAEDKSMADPIAKVLTQHKIAVVSANYRMYPTASYPDFLRDGAAAVAWTREHISEYGECNKIFVGGSSAGGYISMMLCFDKKYLMTYGISPMDIDGFIHDAGQPTCHFNILRERGMDPRRVIIDESAMIYHIGTEPKYPPMLFVVSDNDMENRYEQVMLAVSAIKSFGYDEPDLIVMHGEHCAYVVEIDEKEECRFGYMVLEYIEKHNG